jgi:hypothetical protein
MSLHRGNLGRWARWAQGGAGCGALGAGSGVQGPGRPRGQVLPTRKATANPSRRRPATPRAP